MNRALVSSLLRWGSILLYFVSLLGPAFYVGKSYQQWDSYHSLLIGWLGPACGHFSWVANPFYLIGHLFYRDIDIRRWGSVSSLLFALSFLLNSEILINEGPEYDDIVAYGWGYYLWVTAIVCLVVSSFTAPVLKVSIATKKSEL